jgi:hypothetical protein
MHICAVSPDRAKESLFQSALDFGTVSEVGASVNTTMDLMKGLGFP